MQGERHGRSRRRARIVETELACTEQRRIRHRIHSVDVGREAARHLADPEVPHGRKTEYRRRDPDAERRQSTARVPEEGRDRVSLCEPSAVWIHGRGDIAVRRKADVVEENLVESRPCCGGRNVDVVLPDSPLVGVGPGETCAVAPDRAIAALHGQRRPGIGERRILEDDHATDQVDATGMSHARHDARVVERARGADAPGERDQG